MTLSLPCCTASLIASARRSAAPESRRPRRDRVPKWFGRAAAGSRAHGQAWSAQSGRTSRRSRSGRPRGSRDCRVHYAPPVRLSLCVRCATVRKPPALLQTGSLIPGRSSSLRCAGGDGWHVLGCVVGRGCCWRQGSVVSCSGSSTEGSTGPRRSIGLMYWPWCRTPQCRQGESQWWVPSS